MRGFFAWHACMSVGIVPAKKLIGSVPATQNAKQVAHIKKEETPHCIVAWLLCVGYSAQAAECRFAKRW